MTHWPKLVGPANMDFGTVREGTGAPDLADPGKGLYGPPETKIVIRNN